VKGGLAKINAYRANLHVRNPPETRVPKIIIPWK